MNRPFPAHSNRVPGPVETTMLQKALQLELEEIAELEREADSARLHVLREATAAKNAQAMAGLAKSIYEGLKIQSRTLHSHIAQRKALLHPLRRLPLELLGEIFFIWTQDWDRTSAWKRFPLVENKHHTMPAVVASQVCQRWRDAALATPRLWAHIQVQLDWSINLDAIKLWLARSGVCPLMISLTKIGSITDQLSDLMELLLPTASRWRCLVLQCDGSVICELLNWCQTPMPMLETLSLLTSYVTTRLFRPELPTQLFSASSRLRQVCLENIPFWIILSPTTIFPQLVHLRLNYTSPSPFFSPLQLLSLLRACPSLVHFNCHSSAARAAPHDLEPLSMDPVTLQHLVNLSFSGLCAPAFEALVLNGLLIMPHLRKCMCYKDLALCWDVLMQISPTLCILNCHGPAHDLVPLAEVLYHMPQLSCLSISTSNVTDTFIDQLAKPYQPAGGHEAQSFLCPDLRILSLVDCPKVTGDAVIRLMKSRPPHLPLIPDDISEPSTRSDGYASAEEDATGELEGGGDEDAAVEATQGLEDEGRNNQDKQVKPVLAPLDVAVRGCCFSVKPWHFSQRRRWKRAAPDQYTILDSQLTIDLYMDDIF